MAYSPEVKASIIQVAGDITIEYFRQWPSIIGVGEGFLDQVLDCFEQAYQGLEEIVPQDK
jgi:hypothetical protein